LQLYPAGGWCSAIVTSQSVLAYRANGSPPCVDGAQGDVPSSRKGPRESFSAFGYEEKQSVARKNTAALVEPFVQKTTSHMSIHLHMLLHDDLLSLLLVSWCQGG
jgi:hypothetical protein